MSEIEEALDAGGQESGEAAAGGVGSRPGRVLTGEEQAGKSPVGIGKGRSDFHYRL
jgi:hypothetical protein